MLYVSARLNSGGIDLELAPQVVTALDDLCMLSPRSFDAPSLAALLEEVCLWLVEQRIGPRAQHAAYKSCDPYSQVGVWLFVKEESRLRISCMRGGSAFLWKVLYCV